MPRAASQIVGLVLCSLIGASPLYGAEEAPNSSLRLPISDVNDRIFVPISAGPQMAHARVGQITDDNQGFLWFATRDGLQRYDGYQTLPYRPYATGVRSLGTFEECCATVSLLPGMSRYALLKDDSGKIWIGGDESLHQYDSLTDQIRRFQFAPGDLQGFVRNVYRDRQGTIWLATSHGLVRFDQSTGNTEHFLHSDGDAETLGSNQVRSTLESRNGTFWVATNSSLDLLDRRTGKVLKHFSLRNPLQGPPTIGNPYVRLLEDKSGAIWVASARDGLAFLTPGRSSLTFLGLNPRRKPETGVWAILEDRNGAIWVGSEFGLLKLDRDRQRLIRYRNNPADATSLPSDWVLALYEDREEGIWVGTENGGAARFSDNSIPFRRYRRSDADGHSGENYVFTAYEASDGSVWAGGKGAAYQIDLQTGRYRGRPLPEDTEVRAITEDMAGRIWLGMLDGSLFRLNPATGESTVYKHGSRNSRGCANNEVRAFHADHLGRLWMGAADTLCSYDRVTDRFTAYKAPSPGLNEINAISEDTDGTLWIGSSHFGLYRFDPVTRVFTAYRHSHDAGSLSYDVVTSVLVDQSGTLWAGTLDGLNKLDRATGTFTTYRETEGLPSSIVNGVVADGQGHLWITTSYGLSQFDRTTQSFTNYFRSSGVFDDLTGAWSGRSGRLFFGSYSGLTVLSTQEVHERIYPPVVVALTGLQISDKPVGVGGGSPLRSSISVAKSLILDHNQNTVSFEFAALTFSGPESTRYRYRLRNVEHEWRETQGQQHSVRYSTLAPGRYTFEVQTRTNTGAWTKEGVSIAVTILPPFWATWPFRMAIAALIVLSVWQAHRYRLRQFSRQINLRFEERLAERTRIAQELHDTLLQTFQGASLHLGAAVLRVAQDSPVKNQLDRILEIMRQGIEEGRNAILGLRSSGSHTSDLVGALSRVRDELKVEPDIDFRVTITGRQKQLAREIQHEIYRISREALVNAFCHSGAKRIELELEYSDRELYMRIRDNGCGIDPQVLEKGQDGHWGLAGMRERTMRIGGALKISSSPAAGTEVQLSIPTSLASGLSLPHHSSG